MGRLNIEALPKAPRKYRPSKEMSGFETKADAKREDATRMKRIRNLKPNLDKLESSLSQRDLNDLKAALEAGTTAASAVFMRDLRNRVGGHIYKLVDADPEQVFTGALIPRSWESAGGELEKANPKAMLNGLRSAINRAGFDASTGWIIAGIHGEHEPSSDAHVLHAHVVGSGSARATLDALRKSGCFQSGTGHADKVMVKRRVRLSRKPLTDLPSPLTYVLQSYWPEKPVFEASDGKDMRWWHKRRIEEPRHTEVLHWLYRWRPRDTVLLMGVQVTPNGFERTFKSTRKGGARD